MLAALRRVALGDPQPNLSGLQAESAEIVSTLRDRVRQPFGSSASGLFPVEVPSARSSAGRFIAQVGIDRFSGLRVQIGSELANGILRILCRRIVSVLPTAAIGRAGRATLEFAFESADEAQALTALLALHNELEQPIRLEDQSFGLLIAIGFAPALPHADAQLEDTGLEGAEQALAQAQASHAKCVIFRPEDAIEASARLSLMRDLRGALARDELFLSYQPKLQTRSNEIDCVEALLRWRHPERGLISPERFIGLAEETGDIRTITQWVLRAAVRDQVEMARAGFDISVHINLSGSLVADEELGSSIIAQSAPSGGRIGVEITETAVIADPVRALRNLRAMAAAGVEIAIDDYGVGLSSLAYLKELPASELKIDKLFISSLASSHRDPLLVRSTIELAHALDMQVTAEGVDDAATFALLRIMGCDRVQGYLIAPPLTVPDLVQFLSDQDGRAPPAAITLNTVAGPSR